MDVANRQREVQDKALKWLCENLSNFDLSLEPYQKRYLAIKSLSELIGLASLYKRKFKTIYNKHVEEIISFTVNTLEHANYEDRLIRRPELWTLYAGLYESLYRCGVQLKGLKIALQATIDQGYITATERLPYSMVELSYMIHRIDSRNTSFGFDLSYCRTLFYKNPPVLFMQAADVYALTHAIFYLTDFGYKKINKLTQRKMLEIHWTIAILIGLYLRVRDWDLLGELLICCYCLNWFPYPFYENARNNLLNVQRSDGTIPHIDNGKSDKNDSEESNKDYFEQNYHSTLVTAMLCIMTNEQIPPNNHRNFFELNSKRNRMRMKLRLACKRSYEWLNSLHCNSSWEKFNQSSLLLLLLGEWIYSRAVESSLHRLHVHANRIQQKFDIMQSNKNIEPECDAALALLATGILRKLKLKSKALEDFTKVTCTTLQKHKPQTHSEEVKLFSTRFLAHKLNCLRPLDVKDIQMAVLEKEINQFGINQFGTNKDTLQALSSYLSAKTMFGQQKLSFEPDFIRHIHAFITSAMFHSIYEYNLTLGFELLRTMGNLNMRKTRSFKQALNFLIYHQRSDGRFGFFAPEVSQLLQIDPKFNDVSCFYLPVTVSAIWTFAETLNPEFALFHSI